MISRAAKNKVLALMVLAFLITLLARLFFGEPGRLSAFEWGWIFFSGFILFAVCSSFCAIGLSLREGTFLLVFGLALVMRLVGALLSPQRFAIFDWAWLGLAAVVAVLYFLPDRREGGA